MNTLTAAVAALVTMVTVTAQPADAVPTPAPGIAWQPCPTDTTADCATLTVPIDWAHPDGATATIALARRTATDSAHRIGSLLLVPGGPGGSGVDFVLAGTGISAALRSRFDVVSYDPRGSHRSDPVLCDSTVVSERPTADPTRAAGFDALTVYNRRLEANCRTITGPLYDHVDSLSVTHDIDAIRQGLAEPRLSLLAVSYGTLQAAQYAARYGDHIRALVLDSTIDHMRSARTLLTVSTASVEDLFNQFIQWCNTSTRCALHGQDVATVFDGLYARAQAGTLPDPRNPTNHLSSLDLLSSTQEFFGTPDWAGLADFLSTADHPAARAPSLTTSNLVPYYAPAAFCSDYPADIHAAQQLAELHQALELAAPHMHVSALAWHMITSCLGRDGMVPNPPRVQRIHGTPPILMANSLHDPATSYLGALDVAWHIDNATVLTYLGSGHIAYQHSTCARSLVDTYLISLRTPPPGTSCPAETIP